MLSSQRSMGKSSPRWKRPLLPRMISILMMIMAVSQMTHARSFIIPSVLSLSRSHRWTSLDSVPARFNHHHHKYHRLRGGTTDTSEHPSSEASSSGGDSNSSTNETIVTDVSPDNSVAVKDGDDTVDTTIGSVVETTTTTIIPTLSPPVPSQPSSSSPLQESTLTVSPTPPSQPSSSLSSSSSYWWDHIPMGLPDSILGIAQAYRECTNPNKVNICVGAYRDAAGQPYVLPSVLQAEWQLLHQSSSNGNGAAGTMTNNKEYLPIEGDSEFLRVALQFAYGTDLVQDLSIAAVQTLSGTGACRIGGHFLQQFVRSSDLSSNNNNNPQTTTPTIYIPVPTWGNHWKIFHECGLKTRPYRYYDAATNRLDFPGLMEDITNAPDQSIILLHACAHNPTGCDPTPDQWMQIANVMAQKRHVCFFDSAYQGFASGNAEADAWSIRYFCQRKDIPVLLAQSFAKNFGLYGERCGTLSVVCQSPKQYQTIMSQLKNIIRPMYSSPPKHGSSIVKTVLNDHILSQQYYDECRGMAERIGLMRQQFVQALVQAGSVHDWSHVTNQIGMFAYTGMNANMCDTLTNEYAIYLTRDGRISLAGLNAQNLPYVANAVHAVTFNQPITTTSASVP